MPGWENVRWSLKSADKIFSFLKERKRPALLIALICEGLFLIALSSLPSEEAGEGVETQTLAEYKAELEAELESVCSSVSGVGKCRVVVTFERGAENTYKGSNLIESKPPRVMGVSVVCRGAESDTVRAELTNMLSALFDIGKNRIAVLKLEN